MYITNGDATTHSSMTIIVGLILHHLFHLYSQINTHKFRVPCLEIHYKQPYLAENFLYGKDTDIHFKFTLVIHV